MILLSLYFEHLLPTSTLPLEALCHIFETTSTWY